MYLKDSSTKRIVYNTKIIHYKSLLFGIKSQNSSPFEESTLHQLSCWYISVMSNTFEILDILPRLLKLKVKTMVLSNLLGDLEGFNSSIFVALPARLQVWVPCIKSVNVTWSSEKVTMRFKSYNVGGKKKKTRGLVLGLRFSQTFVTTSWLRECEIWEKQGFQGPWKRNVVCNSSIGIFRHHRPVECCSWAAQFKNIIRAGSSQHHIDKRPRGKNVLPNFFYVIPESIKL
jgi:hypothetical protein